MSKFYIVLNFGMIALLLGGFVFMAIGDANNAALLFAAPAGWGAGAATNELRDHFLSSKGEYNGRK